MEQVHHKLQQNTGVLGHILSGAIDKWERHRLESYQGYDSFCWRFQHAFTGCSPRTMPGQWDVTQEWVCCDIQLMSSICRLIVVFMIWRIKRNPLRR